MFASGMIMFKHTNWQAAIDDLNQCWSFVQYSFVYLISFKKERCINAQNDIIPLLWLALS